MDSPEEINDFVGTKVALINKGNILVSLRDDKPGIDFPGMWDLPGGAREKGETYFETGSREITEELGIEIHPQELIWKKNYPAVANPTKVAVFMVVKLSDEQLARIVLEDEGQDWKMMPLEDFINHENTVPGMQIRVRDFLAVQKTVSK